MDPVPEIDPKKLFEQADKVLNQLARLTDAVLQSMKSYHCDPAVRIQAGNAVQLIVSLRKSVDTANQGA
jgi:hypothetical protein